VAENLKGSTTALPANRAGLTIGQTGQMPRASRLWGPRFTFSIPLVSAGWTSIGWTSNLNFVS